MPFSPRFDAALAYAADVHREQTRKGTAVPYLLHLLAVAALVGEYGGDEDQVIAGLLHDAPEDQGGRSRLEDIARRFGPRVARIVEACTDTFDSPKPPWRERKQAYLAHLDDAPDDALLVSAADKLHNARSIVADLRRQGPAVFEWFNGKKDGTLWYYRELVRIFRRRGACPELITELGHTVDEMERLAGA